MLTLQLEFQFFHLDSTFGQSHFTSLGLSMFTGKIKGPDMKTAFDLRVGGLFYSQQEATKGISLASSEVSFWENDLDASEAIMRVGSTGQSL